jgi:hypothetical protein
MKPVFQVLVVLILTGAIGALVLSFSLDSMVESTIEDTTGQMLNTSVEVDNVGISILDGQGTIDGFRIHNPEGFSNNPAVEIQTISLAIAPYSLLSDTVVIKRLEIKKPEFYYEQKVKGSNFNALTDQLGGSSSTDTHLMIEKFIVTEGRVTLSTDIGGEKSAKATFTRIEIEGIGRQGNNTVDQTIRQVLEPVLKKAAREAVEQGLIDKAKDALQDMMN